MAAWIASDEAGTAHQYALHFRSDNGGEYDLWTSPEGNTEWLARQPDQVLRLTGDGARLQFQLDKRRLPIDQYIGPIQVASFGVAVGATERLVSLRGETFGVTYDADQVEDAFEFTSDQSVVGFETIEHHGAAVRCLKVQRVDAVVFTLSLGGQIRFTQTTTSWHAPFGGAIRSRVTAVVVGADGGSASASASQQMQRGVVNGMGWPERLHASWQPIEAPHADPVQDIGFKPLAALSPDSIVYTVGRWSESGSQHPEPRGLRLLDLTQRSITHAVDFPSGGSSYVTARQVAPDRRSLFAAESNFWYPYSSSTFPDMLLAEAAALGAQVTRYDAQTLAELRRIRLPPAPSALLVGRGYPRSDIRSMAVSPDDGASFAVASMGLLHFRSDSDTPDILMVPDAENAVGFQGSMHREQGEVGGWDAVTGDLHLRMTPRLPWTLPGAAGYRWPKRSAAFSQTGLVEQASFAAPNCCFWSKAGDDLFTVQGLVLSGYERRGYHLFSRDTTLLGSVANATDCTTRNGRLLCLEADETIVEYGLNLQPAARWPLHRSLRFLASQQSPSLFRLLAEVRPGLMIGSSDTYMQGGPVKVDVVSIRYWPR